MGLVLTGLHLPAAPGPSGPPMERRSSLRTSKREIQCLPETLRPNQLNRQSWDIPRWAYADDGRPTGNSFCTRLRRPRQNGYDLWVMLLNGERKSRVFLQTKFDEKFARFSPDGRWVAYVSNESGRGGENLCLLVHRSFDTLRSGESINSAIPAFLSQAALSRVEPRRQGVVPGRAPWPHDGGGDHRGGNTLSPAPRPHCFKPASTAAGLDVNTGGRQFDVAPDGRFLINTLQQNASTSITVLQNWKP